MHIIVINLLDLLIIAHALDWFFTTVRPIRNNKLTRPLSTICSPLNRTLSQITELHIRGNRVAPSALSAICLAFARFIVTALS
ncbi:MAG: hypothetical protein AB7E95_07780 [Kiritimatiellales bacterium]